MKIMENLSMSPKIIKTALALSAIGILAATGRFVALADQVDTTISIDVNPSIEITVNKADEVIEVTALNEDAEIIIGDMDLNDVEVEVAMNAIIGSMVQNGYIDEMKNAVLITVANENESKQQELESLITTEITDTLAENDIAPIVFTQAVDSKGASDTNVKAFAKKYGISVNKAAFIQKILRESEGLSEKELVAMNVEALSEIIHSKNVDLHESVGYSDEALIKMAEKVMKKSENATEIQTEATVKASESQVKATEKQAEAEMKSAERQAEVAVKSEENRVKATENQAVVEEKAAEQSAEVDVKAYEVQIQAAVKQGEAEVKAAEQQGQASEKQAEANAKVAGKQSEATAEANEAQSQATDNQAQANVNGNGNAPGQKGGAAANK
ncbi:anti-sigma-I factor RsgI family protein [Trichococcus collinsii]|uniref:Anti-sigma factor RsgI-like middle domain-containing protein n=1 Tax=Trichococcus collinsii TaxID=157076 RepID=A0AB38A0K7_9LACT|nr:hypothetical protein [Trichococcus collinsii]CZQ90377.1 Hypothetical protein Tcol_996 [Trichococcus collinsii]SEA51462.1 hypothetical protein SAMN04488525_103303 [Trichococcus collinsii]